MPPGGNVVVVFLLINFCLATFALYQFSNIFLNSDQLFPRRSFKLFLSCNKTHHPVAIMIFDR